MFFFRFLCVDSHEFEPGGRGIRRRGGDGHGTAAQAQDDSGRHDLLTLVEALKPSMQCSKMFLVYLRVVFAKMLLAKRRRFLPSKCGKNGENWVLYMYVGFGMIAVHVGE